jgi:nicotinamidase-related amidase
MLETTDTILLVIDVQEKLFGVMDDKESLLSNLQKLVRGLAVLEVPVIVTEQYPQGLGPTLPDISSLITEFSPIPKVCFSCWQNDEFKKKLTTINRKQILISGIEGHICVYQTACDLVRNGYQVHAVTDVISSRNPINRQLSFDMMQQAGARLTGTETVLFELLKLAQGDKFKKISQIVK